MLFDEKDMRVFDNAESRVYFEEILQSYYSKNYRATIVMLYSFVIYDLFMKLQTMANEGDKHASKALKEINEMIADDEKYSIVEKKVIGFFTDNCPLYFSRFIEDVEYLRNCRNKCAHLKVNDSSLYVPNDYHARMLICSMFDNVLSVRAPFIMDLFSIAQPDVERYSSQITYISSEGLDEAISKSIKEKYLKRMTFDSIKKSYKTFIKLLFVSEHENSEKNACGLYAFAYSLTDHIIKEGYFQIFSDQDIIAQFARINPDILRNSSLRRKAFLSIITSFSVVMDIVRGNDSLFEYACEYVLSNPRNLGAYRVFYPRSEKTVYTFFIENVALHQPFYIDVIYPIVKECADFSLSDYIFKMVNKIPRFNGFSDADSFMCFFIAHMAEISIDVIEDVMKIYRGNPQCINRGRHSTDLEEVKKHLSDRKSLINENTELIEISHE